MNFPKSVCTYVILFHPMIYLADPVFSSVNEAICHGIPDKRKLVEGDIVNIGNRVVALYHL